MQKLIAPATQTTPPEWTEEFRGFVVTMCILTATGISADASMNPRFGAARAVYRMVRPLPSQRCTLRYHGEDITLALTEYSYQITVRRSSMLGVAQAFVSQLFYKNALPHASLRYTNVNCALAVAPPHFLDIGILRAAVVEGRCPGLSVKQCSHPRHSASRIVYLVCAQPGKKRLRRVMVIASAAHVSIMGVCDLQVSAYAGAVRRVITECGALGAADHRDAFWPPTGARMTPGISKTLAFIAANPVPPQKPSRRRGSANR